LDSNDFDPFLFREWQSVFRRQLFHYKNLSSFFRENYPTIELETEIIKDGLIKELSISGTFRRTHELIHQLNQYTDFTDAQVKEIALIASTNEQVSWIITDQDVKNFVISTIKGRELIISDEILDNLNHLLGEDIFDLLPF
jgi:hypothetical protein